MTSHLKLHTGITPWLVYHTVGNAHPSRQRPESLASCVGRVDQIDVGVPSDDRPASIATKRMYTVHVTINGRKGRISSFQFHESNTSVDLPISSGDVIRFPTFVLLWTHDELNYNDTSGGETGAPPSNCHWDNIPDERQTSWSHIRGVKLCSMFHS